MSTELAALLAEAAAIVAKVFAVAMGSIDVVNTID
jgi:hypothetical protein